MGRAAGRRPRLVQRVARAACQVDPHVDEDDVLRAQVDLAAAVVASHIRRVWQPPPAAPGCRPSAISFCGDLVRDGAAAGLLCLSEGAAVS